MKFKKRLASYLYKLAKRLDSDLESISIKCSKTVMWPSEYCINNETYYLKRNVANKLSRLYSDCIETTVKRLNEDEFQITAELQVLNRRETFVDLGLPSGIKWSAQNIGFKSQEEPGIYLQYNEIKNHVKEIEIPSKDDFIELLRNCNLNLVTEDNVEFRCEFDECDLKDCDIIFRDEPRVRLLKGIKFVSKINGKSIFFPALGYLDKAQSLNSEAGFYWTRDTLNSQDSYGLILTRSGISIDIYDKLHHFQVRTIKKP